MPDLGPVLGVKNPVEGIADARSRNQTTFWNELYEKPRMNISIFAAGRQVCSKYIFIILY